MLSASTTCRQRSAGAGCAVALRRSVQEGCSRTVEHADRPLRPAAARAASCLARLTGARAAMPRLRAGRRGGKLVHSSSRKFPTAMQTLATQGPLSRTQHAQQTGWHDYIVTHAFGRALPAAAGAASVGRAKRERACTFAWHCNGALPPCLHASEHAQTTRVRLLPARVAARSRAWLVRCCPHLGSEAAPVAMQVSRKLPPRRDAPDTSRDTAAGALSQAEANVPASRILFKEVFTFNPPRTVLQSL